MNKQIFLVTLILINLPRLGFAAILSDSNLNKMSINDLSKDESQKQLMDLGDIVSTPIFMLPNELLCKILSEAAFNLETIVDPNDLLEAFEIGFFRSYKNIMLVSKFFSNFETDLEQYKANYIKELPNLKQHFQDRICLNDLELNEKVEQFLSAKENYSDSTILIDVVNSNLSNQEKIKLILLLILLGANVNAYDFYKGSALIRAAYFGHLKMVELLLAYDADVNIRDFADNTALLNALVNGYPEVVNLLIANGSDVNVCDYSEGISFKSGC